LEQRHLDTAFSASLALGFGLGAAIWPVGCGWTG